MARTPRREFERPLNHVAPPLYVGVHPPVSSCVRPLLQPKIDFETIRRSCGVLQTIRPCSTSSNTIRRSCGVLRTGHHVLSASDEPPCVACFLRTVHHVFSASDGRLRTVPPCIACFPGGFV